MISDRMHLGPRSLLFFIILPAVCSSSKIKFVNLIHSEILHRYVLKIGAIILRPFYQLSLCGKVTMAFITI